MEPHFINQQINQKFHEKDWILLLEIEKKESKILNTFQKLLEQINQNPQYNQSRQSQSSRGRNLLKKLYLEVKKLRSNIKQLNFKMKQLCSETLKTLINELKADQPTRQYVSEKLLRKKLLQSTTIDKVKRNLSYTIKLRCYNVGHNILRLFDVLRNFLSPQMKQIVIISNKHGI